MKTILKLTILAISLYATTASAMDGNAIKEGLESAEASFSEGMALGYMAAIRDTSTHCYPEGVKVLQERDIVLQFLNSHPESRHQHAATLIRAALTNAFPCGKK